MKDLPLSCPMPGMYLWNSHPKVYLPVEVTGEVKDLQLVIRAQACKDVSCLLPSDFVVDVLVE